MIDIQSTIKDVKRVVVKIGTSTLAHENGKLNLRRIEKLVRVLSELQNEGKEVILVTSGAIGVGMGILGLGERPHDTKTKQAVAALGQCELMNIYSRLFAEYDHKAAQILLTKDIIDHAKREENAKNTFGSLLDMGIIPIVNENDSVSVEEIEFGDNDTLSAIVATLVEADLLIILTDTHGLYNKDPRENDDAELIHIVKNIDESVYDMARGKSGKLGTGGMYTKVKAADIATGKNINTIVTQGEEPEIIYDIFDGKLKGTLFIGK